MDNKEILKKNGAIYRNGIGWIFENTDGLGDTFLGRNAKEAVMELSRIEEASNHGADAPENCFEWE